MRCKDLIGPRAKHLGILTERTVSREALDMGLTPVQAHVMGFLVGNRESSPCPKDVEDFFALSRPTVSGILSRLEEKGFIAFHEDPRDRRKKRIQVLERALECAARIHRGITDAEQRLTAGFSPEEKRRFMEYLDRAIGNLMDGEAGSEQDRKGDI